LDSERKLVEREREREVAHPPDAPVIRTSLFLTSVLTIILRIIENGEEIGTLHA
jgi:hypothetical protein